MGWDPFSEQIGIFIIDLKLSRRQRAMKDSSRATNRINVQFVPDVTEAVSLSLQGLV
jgi:hypothetical protein